MTDQQFNELKAELQKANAILEGSNQWHKITYEKLELLSLVLLRTLAQVQPYIDQLGD